MDIEGVSRRKGHTEVTDFIAGGSTEPDFQACAHDPKVQLLQEALQKLNQLQFTGLK